MRHTISRFLAISTVIALITVSLLFVFEGATHVNANPSLASSISSINEYPVPGSYPWGTAFDGSGRVWVAMPGCDLAPSCPSSTPPGRLALFDPSLQSFTTTVVLPTGYGQPTFVAVDSKGKIWFTMPVTNAIGMYDPVSASVAQWAVPTSSAGPWDIVFDTHGIAWFTEHYVNKIGSFDPASQIFHEIATPASNSQPYGITVDASNNIWFTENPDTVALIGEYTNTGALQEYKIRNTATGGTGLTPHLITIAGGNVWWSEGFVGAIGTLNVATAQPGTNNGVTEYRYSGSCSSCGDHTSGISADKQGLIWLDDSLQNTFGSLPIGGGTFSFYATNGHPHDGLNVDTQNRIWYDEEFANKLAVAVQSTGLPTPTATSTPSPTPIPTSTPPSGTVLGQDTFQRANQSLWGTASDGQIWGGDANSKTVFSISNNTGIVANTGGSTYSAVLGPVASDSEVFMTGSISSFASSNIGAVLRWTDGNNWYKGFIDGSSLLIQKKVTGTASILTSVPFAATSGVAYSIHFRVVGSTLTANVWPASGTEPAGWMATASDSTLTSGYSGLRFLTQAGTATITSFRGDVPGTPGTPTPTPIPTPTPTPIPTSTPTPIPTSTPTPIPTSTPPSGTVLSQDTFQRANQSLWGTASDGQIWGGDANSNAAFSISNNTGIVANTGGSTYSAVLGPVASNSEVFMTGSISSFASSNIGAVLRWTDGNNWYKGFIDGSSLLIQKKVTGTASILTSVPFAATPGVAYSIHFRVVGSTLTANVWPASGTEPSGWMITATDTTLTSGRCGARLLTQTGTATITSFKAQSL